MTTQDPAGGAAPDTAPPHPERSPLEILRDDVRSRLTQAAGAAPLPLDRRAVLGIITPLPVPRIVITLFATTAQGIEQQSARIPEGIEPQLARFPVQLELRLDALRDHHELAAAAAYVHRLGVPYVLTLRAAREGGRATFSETERQWLLARLLGAMKKRAPPGSLIDIEAASVATDPVGWKGVIAGALSRGFHLVLSHHDEVATPRDPETLLPPPSLLDDAPGGAAVLYKSATRTNTWEEELAVLAALAAGNRELRGAAIMGMGRAATRLLAPFFRAPLVYASVDAESAAAPGQVPFKDLLATWWRWGIRPSDTGLSDENDPDRDGAAQAPLAPRLALLGRPAWHSLSPAMHNAALRHDTRRERYLPLEVPEDVGGPLAALAETMPWLPILGIIGGNATSPFKEPLARVATRLEGDASVLGAANTFRFEGDEVVATTTDGAGVRGPALSHGVKPAGARILILGAGGAARAAAFALRDAERVTLANRTAERADEVKRVLHESGAEVHVAAWTERAQAARNADLVVHCTRLGMTGTPHADESPLPPDALRAELTVFDLVYDPLETPLLAAARKAGARVIDGLEMLVAQGAAAYTFWTGAEAPVAVMRAAAEEAAKWPLPDSVRAAQDVVAVEAS